MVRYRRGLRGTERLRKDKLKMNKLPFGLTNSNHGHASLSNSAAGTILKGNKNKRLSTQTATNAQLIIRHANRVKLPSSLSAALPWFLKLHSSRFNAPLSALYD